MLYRELPDQDKTARSIANSKKYCTKASKLPQEHTTGAELPRSSIKILKYNKEHGRQETYVIGKMQKAQGSPCTAPATFSEKFCTKFHVPVVKLLVVAQHELLSPYVTRKSQADVSGSRAIEARDPSDQPKAACLATPASHS